MTALDLKALAMETLKKTMLDAMPEDQKNELIAQAIESILITGKAKSKLAALDFRNDLMREAIQPVLAEILRELVNRQDNRRKLEEAAERAVNVFLRALPTLLEDKIMESITEYVPDPEAEIEDDEVPTGEARAAE